MIKKATHAGHCQVCGHLQRLPGDRLSKHGYTVQLGCFQGTCFGSEHLPFQKDISLIERAIEQATQHQSRLEKRITFLRMPAETPLCYISAWKGPHKYQGYQWEEVTVKEDERGKFANYDRTDERGMN